MIKCTGDLRQEMDSSSRRCRDENSFGSGDPGAIRARGRFRQPAAKELVLATLPRDPRTRGRAGKHQVEV